MAEEPQNLSDVLRQLSGALRDGFDRALEEHRAGYTDPHEVGELRNERDAFQKECRRLADLLGRTPEQLRIAQQTCADLSAAQRVLTEERDRWMAEAQELVRQRDATWERKERLEDEVGKLHEELRHVVTRERFEEVLDERDAARSECGALQGGNAQLKSQIENQVAAVRDARGMTDVLHGELREARQTIGTLKTNNAEAARTITESMERIEILERDLGHERTIANRCNDFLREKDIEISELKALVQTLGKDLEARRGGGEPRIDVFDKLENLRGRAESLEQRMRDMESHTHGGAPPGRTTGFPKVGFPKVERG